MDEFSEISGQITSGFWQERLRLNSDVAIFHQWEMLEATHCIDNFRILAGMKEGFREGFFFADSDAYKWLDAAARILRYEKSPDLTLLVNKFICILEKAQQDDGYLYTYNQIHFGNARWQSLQIEHEFYCLGHLIEAGISHIEATGEERLFAIAKKAADLLVDEFWNAAPKYTDGHEEIEIALIKLSRFTKISRYRELAKRLLERRGKIAGYPVRFLWQSLWSAGRMNTVAVMRRQYYRSHPALPEFKLPAHNRHLVPKNMPLRFAISALSGKYAQQHQLLAQQMEPVGHAVRFAYLNTATAMLARDELLEIDLPRMETLWRYMVEKRMSVSGGIGSLPLIEGFGRDYELDPTVVYNETCAALGCMLWNHEMALLTNSPKYDDLFEWQLYNAASVGIGMDGCTYFYNNPLVTQGGYKRESWYGIPCCPSNLSRVWASLAENAISMKDEEIRIHQYFGGEFKLSGKQTVTLRLETALPWEGKVKVVVIPKTAVRVTLSLRKPAWTTGYKILCNGQSITPLVKSAESAEASSTGLDFSKSAWLCIDRVFSPGDCIELEFDMPIKLLQQDERITGCGGKMAVSRGPLLYCLEGINNPKDLGVLKIVSDSLALGMENEGRFNGIPYIQGKSINADRVIFTPYYLWGNHGDTAMSVFFESHV